MKECIIEMIKNPKKFAEKALAEPASALIFTVQIPDTKLIEEDINNLVSFFNAFEKTYNSHSYDDIFCLVMLAANLMIYFSKIELQYYLGEAKEDYYMEKLDIYYAILYENFSYNTIQEAGLNYFMGHVRDTAKHFDAAISHYEKAVRLTQTLPSEFNNYENLYRYFFQLSYACLNAGDDAYERPALALAKSYYTKAIEAANEALSQPIEVRRNELWFCRAKANQGLANITYKSGLFETGLNLFIEAVSISHKGLNEKNDTTQQDIFLNLIKKCSLVIKHLLTKKRLAPTFEQKKLIEENISMLKNYFLKNQSGISEHRTLSKIISEAEGKLFSRTITPYASFWGGSNLQTNAGSTVDSVRNTFDDIDYNRTP